MWGIIINPKAGKKALRKQRKYLFKVLKEKGLKFEYHVTQYAYHAKEIARELVETGITRIMIMGGDGTTNEVINGIFTANIEDTSDIQVALIPRGTGNDWGRFWKLDKNYKNAIEVALNGKGHPIDIGQVSYYRNRELHKYFFINSVGFGIDHYVLHLASKLKHYVGSHSFLYTIALILSIFRYKSKRLTIAYNDTKFRKNLFTMNIGNGPYSGGGIKQNPDADPRDGVFHAMFVAQPSFKNIIGALPHLFNGKLTKVPIVETIVSDKITFKTNKYLPFEADGIEVTACGPFTVSVLHHKLQMIAQ